MPVSACVAGGALSSLSFMSGVLGLLSPDLQQVLQDAFFYCSVREYIMNDIILGAYRELVAVNLAKALGVMSTVIMTIWVSYQGFQIISGENKNPVVPLFVKTGKMVLILSLVSLVAGNSPYIVDTVANFKNLISMAVTGGADITTLIDLNLGIGALLNSITESMKAVDAGKDPNMITTTVGLLGQSGPAMLTGVLLMLAELSITFAIMLAPLFIFFLLFQQTSAMFWSWAKFLLGAMFSMAALTLVGALALKATAVYGGSVVAAYYTNAAGGIGGLINGALGGPFDISGSSLRLAALGTLMSAIIISIPPTIMQFFSAGAGFAAGAFGFVGAGALAGAMGQSRGMGGGTGVAGMAYGQLPGGQTAQSSAQPGQASQTTDQASLGYSGGSATQAILTKANSNVSYEASEGSGGANGRHAGSMGLAGRDSSNDGLVQLQNKQASMAGELREGTNISSNLASRSWGGGSEVEDARLKSDPLLGRGGRLGIQDAGSTSKASASLGPGTAGGGSSEPPPTNKGDTNTHAAPSGNMGSGTRPNGAAYAGMPYGDPSSKPNNNNGKTFVV